MTDLPEQNRENIEKIKDALIAHNEDDKMQFYSLNTKLDQINESTQRLSREIANLSEKVNPVVKWFDNISFGKLAVMWLLGIIGSVVAISLGLKNLFNK